jgi:hypothetical protein
MAKNPALESLQKIIAGAESDLKKLRAINSTLHEKVTALQERRKEFRAEFIAEEVGKLRATATAAVRDYMARFDPLGFTSSPVMQDEYWTTTEFLNRSLVVSDPHLLAYDKDFNANELMKALLALTRQSNLLLSLPRLPTGALQHAAETALAKSDWPVLALAYSEAQRRAEGNDDRAQHLAIGILSSTIPDVQEGKTLAAQASHLKEKLGYALRAIEFGTDDLGLKMEGYQVIADERRAMQAHNAATERQAAITKEEAVRAQQAA